jgi:hypothetical protein
LDFRKYGKKIPGPAVGAIATKSRDGGGGHVTVVVGRTADGKIVGRGGNQNNMVCDEAFDPSVFQYNWPNSYPSPITGIDRLPIVTPEPATKRIVSLGDIATDYSKMMREPKSIQTNNPGAMWGGARATKWGATDDIKIGDKQGNHIAVFPTKTQGAAAQFDLWRTGYCGLTLAAAIKRWSGDNDSLQYVAFIRKNAAIDPDEKITVALLSGPRGFSLMKAQAQWEAGKVYPMTDAEWALAQKMVFGAVPPPPDIEKPDQPETKPAVQSTELWAAFLAFIGAAGNLLTDWKFLLFVTFIGLCFLAWKRWGRGDLSGLFK